MSSIPRLRANAIEFLDNVLDSELKKSLIPIVENARPQILKTRKPAPGSRILAEETSIELVLKGDDVWLSACAIYLIAMLNYRQFLESVRPLAESGHPLVKETARLCIQRLDHS
jgi:AAA family ATP:ADP antiporter